jgi:hypothetical protein
MSVNVKDGTPMHGPSLCESCSQGYVAAGYRATEMLVICDALCRSHLVPFPVRKCTHYLDKNRRDVEEMEKVAWIIDAGGTRRKAGFEPAESATGTEREIELTLDGKE